MNHSILALAAGAIIACAALPCLAEDAPAAQQASQDGTRSADQAAPAAAKDDGARDAAKDAAAPSTYQVPDVTVKNCSDNALLDQMIARLKQAEEKSDLSRSELEAARAFSQKCQAVLRNQ